MARIRKHGVNFSGEGAVEGSEVVVAEVRNEGFEERDEMVDGVEKLGSVDMEIDEKGRDEVKEGSEGARFQGSSDVNAASEKGAISESKGVEGSVFRDKDIGKYEILGARSGSMSFEEKEDVKVEGKDEVMRDAKEEASEKEHNVEHCEVDEKSVCAVGSSVEVEATGSVEVGATSIDVPVDGRDMNASAGSQMVTENPKSEGNVGVKTGKDELMPEYVPPAEVSVDAENENNLIDVPIELEPYSGMDGDVSDDSNDSSPSKPEFQAFDLVWGKVRSHPWWPGQICDPSAASKQAMKYFKKRSYLIAYFWDCSFAWNEAPQIKPFWENFSQMEKQSNMEEFQNAVDCALDEVSRRVEFGLACSCISKEVYANLKTQTILNAGVKEEASKRDGGDNSLGSASFEPLKLIKFAKQAAKFPFRRADRLELVTSRAQLSSFNRWKGYSQLPEFNFLGGLLEHDADISLLREKEQLNEQQKDTLPVIKDEELVQKSKGKDSSVHKRKQISGDGSQPSKKGKNSSKVTGEKGSSTPMSENGSEMKAGSKLVSQSSSKKRKAVDSTMSDDSAVKHSKPASLPVDDYVPGQGKQTFRVGDRICRVASLLNGSSPIFRHCNAAPDAEVQDEGNEKSTPQKPQTEKLIDMEDTSADEMLSQLCLAAINPNKGYSTLISLIACFSKFRNTICLEPPAPPDESTICMEPPTPPDERTICMEPPSPDEDQLPLRQIFGGMCGKKSIKTGKKSSKPRISKESKSELVKDSIPSDEIVKSRNENEELMLGAASNKDTCVLESQSSLDLEAPKLALYNGNEELVHGADTSDKDASAVQPQASIELNPNLDSEQNIACGDLDSKAVNPPPGNENGALACELSPVFESPADLKSNPNLENTGGGTTAEAVNPALDNENGELVAGASKYQANPELDSGQENAGGDTSLEVVMPALDCESGELVAGAVTNKDVSAVEPQASLELNRDMDSPQKFADGDHDSEAVKPDLSSENSEEDSPAALILNFSNSESLPSEANLNKIFSCFGPLNESQTELLKKTNRAKVVFRRRCDAQKAFSSAGKYSTFGPSLESYRLKYPLSPSKASPSPKKMTKQGKTDASAEGDGDREP